MPLRKTSGNMYGDVDYTWNPIKGKCLHDCSYCYMKAMNKRFKIEQKPLHLDEREMKTNLGSGNFIFVGSSCDMWARDVPEIWINNVLSHCLDYENRYLLQTKDTERYNEIMSEEWLLMNKEQFVLGTTIETNRDIPQNISRLAPEVWERVYNLEKATEAGYKTMVTVEPIMDFDVKDLAGLIWSCHPMQVNIGADSGNNHLQEPTKEQVLELITELKKFTKVVLKKNLGRIIK
jgi:DNA repair photolyase